MSKIPVEKQRSSSGMPWWGWLLIAVAVILVIWLVWPWITGVGTQALLAPTLAALIAVRPPQIIETLEEV